MEQIRLQKLLANSGICSRRKAEEYILAGKVKVNGKIITELGTKVNPAKDEVTFEGKVVKNVEDKIYILLNKPIGYVTTAKDQFNRETVLDLINIKEKVVPVGRLDMYTSGALILSNDGEFIYKVTHPKYEIEKAYNVTLKGKVTEEEIKALEKGVKIEDYVSGKAKVKILKIDEEKDVSRIEIIIHEGKNREVRKMCNAIGKKVLALHRSRIGNLNVVLYVLFCRQEVYFREEEMIRNQLKELEYESAHYRELEQHQQEIRRIRHDIKNELSGIYGYLENGEVGEGKKEIEILLQQMTAAEQKIFTANAVVNGILNLKLQKMEMAQTEYEFDIHIPEQLKIQGTDLGVLLGNLLDNAIEACQEFQGEKKIRLLMEYQNSGVVIHCENPCNEDTETLQTKKKDKINHGFGMGSIAQIVKKYDGFWEYQMKSGLFKVTVNLWEREMI